MSKRRVVVTGLGAISPMGLTVKESWESILAGKSGIETITHFDVSDFPSRIGGTIKNFNVRRYLPIKDAKKNGHFHPLWHCGRYRGY